MVQENLIDINISTLVPLILLIVAVLANTSREVEIIEVANYTNDDVYLLNAGPFEEYVRKALDFTLSTSEKSTKLESDELSSDLPKLGRFNHIHAFNSFLIAVAQILTVLSEASLSGAILSGTIGVFWIVLPIIEIEEYDLMMRNFEPDDPLFSLTVHIVCTIILTLPAVVLSFVDVTIYPIWVISVAGVVYLILTILVSNFYQSHLNDELEILRKRGVKKSDQEPEEIAQNIHKLLLDLGKVNESDGD